jgi:hypothetical protein
MWPTLAYGLTDSPVGLAAWIVEKWRAWSDRDGEVARRFSNDQLLAEDLQETSPLDLHHLVAAAGP